MTTYTSAFGGTNVPPSAYEFRAFNLTADLTLYWPDNTDGTDLVANLMNVTPSGGVWNLTLPAANEVSTGRDILIRNLGAVSMNVLDNAAGALATILAGESRYFYITSNATAAGTWSTFTYGTGTSSADAAALAGSGLEVVSGQLSTDIPCTNISVDKTFAADDRSKGFVYGGGTRTWYLPNPSGISDGYYVAIINSGTGTLTLDAATASGLIDDQNSKMLQPGESAFVVCDALAWYTVGYGRSSEFQFTQLAVDVSSGGAADITITNAQAANKLWYFYNVAAGDRNVVIPTVASVYFLRVDAIGAGNDLTFTTGSGSSVTLSANQSYTIYCDGTNVVSAQTVAVTSTVALDDGSAATPSMTFSLDNDTGIYRSTTNTLGVTTNGSMVALFSPAGMTLATDLAVTEGGTGRPLATAYALVAGGTTDTGAHQSLTVGATTEILVGGGAAALPVWTAATGSGAPVRATSPTLVTPVLGVATGTSLAVTTLDSTNLEVTNLKAKDGTAAGSIADSTGVVTLASAVLTTADIDGGTIDGTVIGGSSAAAITGTTITANTGFVGAHNGTVGATTPAAGKFTTLTSTGNATLGDDPATDTHTINGGLTIKNTGAGNCLLIEDSASTDASPVAITNTGFMVLGHTAAPNASPLEIYTSGAFAQHFQQYSADGNPIVVTLAKTRGLTPDADAVVLSGDGVGRIQFVANDGTSLIRAAQIECIVDGTPGTNDMPGRLVFSTTADGASSPTEALRIDSKQNVGIGGTASAGRNLQVSKNITGATFSFGMVVNGVAQSDVTSSAYGFNSEVGTQAAAFSTVAVVQYQAKQGTFGAGSSVTNNYGFLADSNLIGATNNYGFYGNIAAGTGRWNFYAAGTAANYFGGGVGIGSNVASDNYNLRVGGTAGSSQYPVVAYVDTTIPATANGGAGYYVRTYASTAAASFTTNIEHFTAAQGTFGAGSTVTSQIGFRAEPTLTGATNNYGFYGNIAAGTGRWNFYAAGTAANYFGGLVDISGASAGQIKFPATQNASADANTLDDYREGTFTPVFTPASGAFGAVTYDIQVGTYTKTGNRVDVTITLRTDAFAVGTGTGDVSITGLPFTSAERYASGCFSTSFTNNPSVIFSNASATALIPQYRTTPNGDMSVLNCTHMVNAANSNYFSASFSYRV